MCLLGRPSTRILLLGLDACRRLGCGLGLGYSLRCGLGYSLGHGRRFSWDLVDRFSWVMNMICSEVA